MLRQLNLLPLRSVSEPSLTCPLIFSKAYDSIPQNLHGTNFNLSGLMCCLADSKSWQCFLTLKPYYSKEQAVLFKAFWSLQLCVCVCVSPCVQGGDTHPDVQARFAAKTCPWSREEGDMVFFHISSHLSFLRLLHVCFSPKLNNKWLCPSWWNVFSILLFILSLHLIEHFQSPLTVMAWECD